MRYGVTHVFGQPGGQTAALYDGIAWRPGIRGGRARVYITCARYEYADHGRRLLTVISWLSISGRPITDPTINATISRMSRIKVSVTLDPELLGAVDGFVQSHPGQDRSKVIDQALHQWYTQQQDTAMEAQYARAEGDVIGPERKAWRAIRRSAARRRLSAT